MATLTAIVLTRNEAGNLADCLKSLAFADRRLVVDCGSTDGTLALAAAGGAEVMHRDFDDFSSQRNFALAQVNTDWALMIDADERVPEALAAEIRAVVKSANGAASLSAYRLPRDNYYLGGKLRFCGAGRDSVVRLFKAGAATYVNLVHETPQVQGAIGDFSIPLEHHTVRRLEDSLRKVAQYSPLSARDMHARGRRVTLPGIVLHAGARFIKVYFVKLGILDGARGFLVATFETWGVFAKYAGLWEMGRREKN